MSQQTPQFDKIKGRYIDGKWEGGIFRLQYVTQHGNRREKVLSRKSMSQFADMAGVHFAELFSQWQGASDELERERIEDDMEYEHIQILWPTMFSTAVNGGDLSVFFDDSGIEEKAESKVERKYSPNLKYQDFHHERFRELCNEGLSQEKAYDKLVKEFPKDIEASKFDSFAVRHREWVKSKSNLSDSRK